MKGLLPSVTERCFNWHLAHNEEQYKTLIIIRLHNLTSPIVEAPHAVLCFSSNFSLYVYFLRGLIFSDLSVDLFPHLQ